MHPYSNQALKVYFFVEKLRFTLEPPILNPKPISKEKGSLQGDYCPAADGERDGLLPYYAPVLNKRILVPHRQKLEVCYSLMIVTVWMGS